MTEEMERAMEDLGRALDKLCYYDKTTCQMIQDAVLEKEEEEIDCGNSYIKMHVNKNGCLVFEQRLKKE